MTPYLESGRVEKSGRVESEVQGARKAQGARKGKILTWGSLYAASLAAMALLTGGCGSQGTRETSTLAGGDVVTTGVTTHRPTQGTGGSSVNDDNPGHPDSASEDDHGSVSPCKLVTHSQAQTIVGHPLEAPQEAPLGPTCIYTSKDSASTVTVAVEAIDFATVRAHMRGRKQFKVDGHRAYCGSYGQQMTYVPLSGGRVLNVTAPCSQGLRFAAAALPHLES
jgi:hypothetical protein